MQRRQVPHEGQEFGTPLVRLDVSVEFVGGQIVGGEQVPHPVRAVVGRPPSVPSRRCLLPAAGSRRRPLVPRMGHQVQRPELIEADDDFRVVRAGFARTLSDLVNLIARPGFGLVDRIIADLPCFEALERSYPLRATACAVPRGISRQPPLGHQVIRQFRQAPGGKQQAVVCGTLQGELLDLLALLGAEFRGSATGVVRV